MTQSPLAIAVQGIGFGPLAIATHGLQGVGLGARYGGGSGKRSRGWLRERAIFEASQRDRFAREDVQPIAQTLAQSDQPQAWRIARKLLDYTGEAAQIESLRRELAKLEAAQTARVAGQAKERDVAAAAAELADLLRDEDDTMQALLALEGYEASQLFMAIGLRVM